MAATNKYPALNLPPVRLRATNRNGCDCIWDRLRKTWLVLTPEEWVRQHVINWLTEYESVPPELLIEEYPLNLNGTSQRADIVAVTRNGSPAVLIECKAPQVTIDEAVLNQAVRYNSVLGAQLVMLTNGLNHYFYTTQNGISYAPCNEIPHIASLIFNDFSGPETV